MGNQISIPAAAIVGNAFNSASASNAPIKFALPTEILFEILAFVKFYEAPNIFLVNRYLLPICQVYFHSGTVGQNKVRNVRNLILQLTEGIFTIFVERNGTWQSVPMPEVDPPEIFNAFGRIIVKKCCQIDAIKFLNKYQSLLNKNNNEIICWPNFFVNNAIDDQNEKQNNPNSPHNFVVSEKQLFLNWIGQKKLWLELKSDPSSEGIARCLSDVPLIAQFNGRLFISFKNEQNLCGLEEDAKLIYGWISAAETRLMAVHHYDAQKAKELVCQIVLLFEKAHVNKKEAEKMDLEIVIAKDTVVPMHMQKVCNGIGDQLATLRTLSVKCNEGEHTTTYAFYTKPLEYYYENNEFVELLDSQPIYFL